MAIIPSYLGSATLQEYLPAIFGIAAVANALSADRKPRPVATDGTPVGTAPATPRRGPVAARMAVTKV
jgi:hypothetical protein